MSMTDTIVGVGDWVKRGRSHTIEHYITADDGEGMLITACGKRMRRGPAVIGTSREDSAYRCVTCTDAARVSALLGNEKGVANVHS
jgi:hypothetical protein